MKLYITTYLKKIKALNKIKTLKTILASSVKYPNCEISLIIVYAILTARSKDNCPVNPHIEL